MTFIRFRRAGAFALCPRPRAGPDGPSFETMPGRPLRASSKATSRRRGNGGLDDPHRQRGRPNPCGNRLLSALVGFVGKTGEVSAERVVLMITA